MLVVAVLAMVGGLHVARPDVARAHPLPPGVVADDSISPLFATIDSVTPSDGLEGIDLTLYGSIAHVDLAVPRGREVVVLGYSGEPYQRITDRGAVQLNLASPTLYTNRAVDGTSEGPIPPVDAEPRWSTLTYGGSTDWHDHRLHWMAPGEPSTFEGTDVVAVFSLELVVDGEPVSVEASLRRRPNVSMSRYLVALPGFESLPSKPDRRVPAALLVGCGVLLLGAGGAFAVTRGRKHLAGGSASGAGRPHIRGRARRPRR